MMGSHLGRPSGSASTCALRHKDRRGRDPVAGEVRLEAAFNDRRLARLEHRRLEEVGSESRETRHRGMMSRVAPLAPWTRLGAPRAGATPTKRFPG